MLSHLYIVESKHGLIKIGRSSCHKRRISEIAKAIGTPVIKQYLSPLCLNAHKIERYLHKHFAEYRKEGEWFKLKFQIAVKEAKKQEFQTDKTRDLMPFEFNGDKIRTLFDEKEEPWFVAKDVCKVVEITKYRDAIVKLDNDERMSMLVDTLGGKQKMVCVIAIPDNVVYKIKDNV